MDKRREQDSIFLQKDPYIAHVDPVSRETQSVSEHLSGTMWLAVQNNPLKILENILKVTAVSHDAGKLSPEFFSYMEDVYKYGEKAKKHKVDHTSAGGRIIRKIVGQECISDFLSVAVYSHHGLQDCIDMKSGESLFEKRRKSEIDFKEIEERYFQIVDKKGFIELLLAAHADMKKIIAQLKAFVDGQKDKKCGSKEFYLGMYERLLLSVLIDSDWTDAACFSQGEVPSGRIPEKRVQKIWEEAIAHFEKYMEQLSDYGKKSPLNVYRNEISDLCYQAAMEPRNLYRLTVPTGAGKTFSSLRFALYHAQKFQKRHIIYVSPYNSILEQNAEDIRQAVGNEEFVLEHHCNVFYEDEERELTYKKLTENWDCPIIATTAVQMLNTLFSDQKSSIRRMHNLCNSVIIFDEVQALPVKGTELFNLAVNFLTTFGNATIILCSATQPSLARLKENNLRDCKEMAGEIGQYSEAFQRVEFEDQTNLVPGGMLPEDVSKLVYNAFRKYGSVLIIVNTKKCAKLIYRELKRNYHEEYQLYHLSTNMCPQNRKDELDSIRQALEDRQPVICVSTQLIEAGVDISFGCVIRSLAGLDSIIQAAGRCNRHKEVRMGKVYIVKMAQEMERLTGLYDMKRAQEAFDKFLYHFRKNPEAFQNTIDSKEAVTAYYQEFFSDSGVEPTKYPSQYEGITLEELLGKNGPACKQFDRQHRRKRVEQPYLGQAFRTAGETYEVIPEDGKVTVVIPYDDTARKEIEKLEDPYLPLAEQKKALRILQRYSVGVSENSLKKLGRAVYEIRDTGVRVLSMDYYDKKEGVLEEPKNRFLNF